MDDKNPKPTAGSCGSGQAEMVQLPFEVLAGLIDPKKKEEFFRIAGMDDVTNKMTQMSCIEDINEETTPEKTISGKKDSFQSDGASLETPSGDPTVSKEDSFHDDGTSFQIQTGDPAISGEDSFLRDPLAVSTPQLKNKKTKKKRVTKSRIRVLTAVKTAENKRIYNKVHYCLFCREAVIHKMSCHISTKHKDESEVIPILAREGPQWRKWRNHKFAELLRKGDFQHNARVLATKKGTLIVTKRPGDGDELIDPSQYLPCPYCLGFSLKSRLYQHVKRCKVRKEQEEGKEGEKKEEGSYDCVLRKSKNLLGGYVYEGPSEAFERLILADLSDGSSLVDVTEVVRKDFLIKMVGMQHFNRYAGNQRNGTRTLMRQLGRLVLALNSFSALSEVGEEKELKDFMRPSCYGMIIHKIKELTGFHLPDDVTDRPEFEKPSYATRVGYHLKSAAELWQGYCDEQDDYANAKHAKKFLQKMQREYTKDLTSSALFCLKKRKLNKVEELPLTEDVQKFADHINSQIQQYSNSMAKSKYVTKNDWRKLARAVLVKLIIFNRRRSGETARLKIADYTAKPNWSKGGTQEFAKTLTSLEKNMLAVHSKITVVGKKHSFVDIIIPNSVREAMKILFEHRHAVGINENNPYFFCGASHDARFELRGSDAVRDLAAEAGLKNHQAITSTKYRKYLSTTTQLLDLTDKERRWITKFLGHSLQVNDQFYNKLEHSAELCKVVKLLHVADKGMLHKYKGKRLEEIPLEDIPMIEEEEEDGEVEEQDGEVEEVDKDREEATGDMEPVESLEEENAPEVDESSKENIDPFQLGTDKEIRSPVCKKRRQDKKGSQAVIYHAKMTLRTKHQPEKMKETTETAEKAHSFDSGTDEDPDFDPEATSQTDSSDEETEKEPPQRTQKAKTKAQVANAERLKGKKQPWSGQEDKLIRAYFQRQIDNFVAIGKASAEEVLKAHPDVFKNRTWRDIKYAVKNRSDTVKRIQNKGSAFMAAKSQRPK